MFKMCYAVYIRMLSLEEVSDLRREVVSEDIVDSGILDDCFCSSS